MNKTHVNPPLNGSSAEWQFELGEVIKICDETIFGFYMGLSHVGQAMYMRAATMLPLKMHPVVSSNKNTNVECFNKLLNAMVRRR